MPKNKNNNFKNLHGFAHLCFLPSHDTQIWEENFEYNKDSKTTDTKLESKSSLETLITNNETTNSTINSKGISEKNILSKNVSPKYFIGHFVNITTYKNYGIKATLSPTPPPPSHNIHNCLLEHPIYYDLTLQDYNIPNNNKWTFKWVGWWNGDAGWMSSDPNCNVNGEQYIWFHTNRLKADQEAQKHIEKFFPKLLNEIDQDDLNNALICLGEMKVVIECECDIQETDEEEGGEEGIYEEVNEEDNNEDNNSEFLDDDN
ncbi:7680_t:CDS:2 [Diversispora eburnea]|uniref:7680_t:CDS:1 n=1 Tax=Diversispora eburnea TaxID=1213867 RepID=A0A9N8Z8M6_9GLOM|nr:7680_t:CDS:2 [Diversispora eburnea]